MKRWISIILCLLLVGLAGCLLKKDEPSGVFVQGNVTAYGDPLEGAVVMALGSSAYAVSDDGGNFSLNLVAGTYILEVSRMGYHTATREITVGDSALSGIDFVLEDAPYFAVDFGQESTGVWTEIPGVREFKYEAPEIVDSPSRSGKSVKMTGYATGYKDAFYYVVPEPMHDELTVETWLLPTGGERSIGLSVSNESIFGDGDAVSLYLHNSGVIRYFAEGKWNSTGATYTANEWIRIKVVLDIVSQTYDIYVNDMTTKVATAPFRNLDRTEITQVGFFMLGVGTEPDPVYVDSLIIRRRDM